MSEKEDDRKWHNDCYHCKGSKTLFDRYDRETKKTTTKPCDFYESTEQVLMELQTKTLRRIATALEKIAGTLLDSGSICELCGGVYADDAECTCCGGY